MRIMLSPAESTSPVNRHHDHQEVADILGVGDQPQRGFARVRKWLVVAVIAAAVIGGGAYWMLSGNNTTANYVTEPASRGNLTVLVTATGSVQPTNKVDVSSEVSGTVRKVLVDYNSVVKADEPLAILDTDKLEATVQSTRARLAAAKARVSEMAATIIEKRGDLDRKQALRERNVSSIQDLALARAAYDRAMAAHANAVAEVQVAEADLRLNETNLARAVIRSPVNGVVLSRKVDPGQTVAVSLQAPVLFTIAEDLRKMELQVDVDEADVGKVKIGQRATFGVDAYPDRKFPAAIRDVRYGSEVVQGVVTYKALLEIDNSELLLRPGMTATAEIVVQEVKDALLVPNAALRFSPPSSRGSGRRRSLLEMLLPFPRGGPATKQTVSSGARRVWILGENGPIPVTVATGASDGRKTEVLKSKLSADQPVIVDLKTDGR